MRPLNNHFLRHSGLDPESGNCLKLLDSGLRGNDDSTTYVMSFKGLTADFNPSVRVGGVMNLADLTSTSFSSEKGLNLNKEGRLNQSCILYLKDRREQAETARSRT